MLTGQSLGRVLSVVTCAGIAVCALSQPAPGQCEIAKLYAGDGAAEDYFGNSVAFSGDVAVFGSLLDDERDLDSGAAYLFRFDGSEWVEEQKLMAADGESGDQFGMWVSMSGDVALVGAWLDDDGGADSGSAYIFRFNGASWVQQQKLTPSDGDANDSFGYAVSVSDDVAIVGTRWDDDNGGNSGSAYAFRFNGLEWVEEQKLLAADGEAGDNFAFSVSASGDVVVVGAHRADPMGQDSGAAYVFRFDGAEWVHEQKLVPPDGHAGAWFGDSVAVKSDVALIGAYYDDENGAGAGAAYVFRYDGAEWQLEQKILPNDGHAGQRFGKVSLDDDIAVIGAQLDDENGFQSGAAYVFRRRGGEWVQEAKLVACDAQIEDQFANKVAVNGNLAVLSAPYNDDNGADAGAVYVVNLQPPVGDLNCDEIVGASDLMLLLGAWGRCVDCSDCVADLDGNCTVGTTDLVILLGNWG